MSICNLTARIFDDSRSISLGNITNMQYLQRDLIGKKSRSIGLIKVKDEYQILSLKICFFHTERLSSFPNDRYSYGAWFDNGEFENLDVTKVEIEGNLKGITRLDSSSVSFKVHLGCDHAKDGVSHVFIEKKPDKFCQIM